VNEVQVLAESEQAAFISDLVKSYPASMAKPRVAGFSARSGSSIINLDDIQAVVDGPNVIGMFDGMSRRNKRIALNTYRFAEIMATNKYPAKHQIEQRFQFLISVLTALKWTKVVQVSKAY